MAQTVMVLFGGVSTEYLVSLRSAYNIAGGLTEAGYRVITAGITQDGTWLRYNGPAEGILQDTWQAYALQEMQLSSGPAQRVQSPRDMIVSLCGLVPECIFPAVHGINCEDGTLQGLLTLTGIPYVGCGVLASAACMDKLHARKIFRAARIPQCRYTSATRPEIEKKPDLVRARVARAVGYPCFLKPSNGGSSVGTRRVASEDELIEALTEVSQYDRVVLIESFIRAREIEVAVMGNDRLKLGEIGEVATSSSVDYYDYEAKYFLDDGADIIIPARLDDQVRRRIRRYAVRAYQAMGCSGLARVDFFLCKETGAVYLNEINTLPGFTPISIFPKAFAAAGLPLPRLLKRLCRLAMERQADLARKERI